jgi:hypothetical protein
MDAVAVLLLIIVWLVVLGAALIRAPGTGGRGQIGTWLVLTGLTMSLEFIIGFIFSYALLFALGTGAATVGVVASAIILVATPLVWALVLRRRARRSAVRG